LEAHRLDSTKLKIRNDIDLESTHRVINSPAPTSDGHLATKAYVDASTPSFGTNYVTVATSGGDYSSVASAVSSESAGSASNPRVILVYPGVYAENTAITLKSYMHVVGIDRDSCILTFTGISDYVRVGNTSVTGSGISDLTLRRTVSDNVLQYLLQVGVSGSTGGTTTRVHRMRIEEVSSTYLSQAVGVFTGDDIFIDGLEIVTTGASGTKTGMFVDFDTESDDTTFNTIRNIDVSIAASGSTGLYMNNMSAQTTVSDVNINMGGGTGVQIKEGNLKNCLVRSEDGSGNGFSVLGSNSAMHMSNCTADVPGTAWAFNANTVWGTNTTFENCNAFIGVHVKSTGVNQSIPNSTETKCTIMGTVTNGISEWWDTGTDRITVPWTGTYAIESHTSCGVVGVSFSYVNVIKVSHGS
jgi:hypothetical protein